MNAKTRSFRLYLERTRRVKPQKDEELLFGRERARTIACVLRIVCEQQVEHAPLLLTVPNPKLLVVIHCSWVRLIKNGAGHPLVLYFYIHRDEVPNFPLFLRIRIDNI